MLEFPYRWRAAWFDRQAARWVLRIDEDRAEYEPGLRQWIGRDQARADAYNRAYRAFLGAKAPARTIYGEAARRGVIVRSFDHRPARTKLILVSVLSVIVASIALYIVLTRLTGLTSDLSGNGALEQEYTTRVGEVRPLQLADGSRLLLDTNTDVRVMMSATARRVIMIRGRARFTVAHDASRPFSVIADGATITDRGTIFDVEAYRDVKVRLISGAIDVALKRPSGATASPIRLHAGQQLRFDPATAVLAPAPTVGPASDVQWVTGQKTFDDVPARDILAEVNRYSATQIEFADTSLASRQVFLDLNIRDSAAAAQNLALYMGLNVDGSQPGKLILRQPTQPN